MVGVAVYRLEKTVMVADGVTGNGRFGGSKGWVLGVLLGSRVKED